MKCNILIRFGIVMAITSILTSFDIAIVIVGSLLVAAGLIYEFVKVNKN